MKDVLTHLSQPSHAPSTNSSSSASNTMASGTAGRKLPTFDELPPFKDFTGCAWEVWGKDDQLGTINLLTDEVVKEASKEIKCVIPFTLRTKSKHPFNPGPLTRAATNDHSCSRRTGKAICLNWCVLICRLSLAARPELRPRIPTTGQ